MCRTRLAQNTGRKKSPKIRHLGTIAQLCPAASSQLRHVSTIGKKLAKQQYLLVSFNVLCVNDPGSVLAVGERKNPLNKKLKRILRKKDHVKFYS